MDLKFNYSFIYFFIDFFIFNKIYHFNFFFINFIFKIILILKILLLKGLNFLILIKLKKKNSYLNTFFDNNFYLNSFSLFNYNSMNKLFNNYKYLLIYLFKKLNNKVYLSSFNFDFIITLNFDNFFLKKLSKFNIPILNFNYFYRNIKGDYIIFNNSYFLFYFVLFFLK